MTEVTAILTEECPCDDCPNFDYCKDEEMACRDFLLYTNDGLLDRLDDEGNLVPRDREPKARHYRVLFPPQKVA